ncbi:unnamed protein product [Calicophoron daubneyi]|uniref:Cell division control protein n=1 Tax=Calicophoron daubneyi TaxID=300641 RepID=A0AAV2T6Y0_CALDB
MPPVNTRRHTCMDVSVPSVTRSLRTRKGRNSDESGKKKAGLEGTPCGLRKKVLIKQAELSADDHGSSFTSLPEIVGRAKERDLVRDFIHSCISRNESNSMYISGAPGTGKTAVVLHEARAVEESKLCQLGVVNCMQLSSVSDIYTKIHSSLYESKSRTDIAPPVSVKTLENKLNARGVKGAILLVLDEADQLCSGGQGVLHHIFEWPAVLSCHIIIIAISNALDLPQKFLTRLRSKSYNPKHVAFPPYTRDELAEIVTFQLKKKRTKSSSLDPIAIQLCARKISASTGDVRTALNICQRAIDLALQEAQERAGGHSKSNDEVVVSVQPTLRHISLALKESQIGNNLVCGPPSDPLSVTSGESTPSKNSLPLHQKLVVATCRLLRKQKNLSTVTFSQLYDCYSFVCNKFHLARLEESEVADACVLLDARCYVSFSAPKTGIFAEKLGTPARCRRVQLKLDDRAIDQLFTGDDLLSAVMYTSVP